MSAVPKRAPSRIVQRVGDVDLRPATPFLATSFVTSLATGLVGVGLVGGSPLGCVADDVSADAGDLPDDDPPDDEPDGDDSDDDDPEQIECAPDRLDACPPDTKCTAITAPDNQSFEYACVMDKGELGPNDVCMPSPPTGIDGCPSGFACIPDTNLIPTEGHCLALCLDDEGCLDGLCAAMPTSPVLVCAEACNPLLATCPATHACRLLEDRAFACVIPLPDDIGVQGAACDGINQLGCANAFVCMPSFQVPDCLDSDFCCTAVCPVDSGGECPGLSTCQALELDPPPLANVGLCTL